MGGWGGSLKLYGGWHTLRSTTSFFALQQTAVGHRRTLKRDGAPEYPLLVLLYVSYSEPAGLDIDL